MVDGISMKSPWETGKVRLDVKMDMLIQINWYAYSILTSSVCKEKLKLCPD